MVREVEDWKDKHHWWCIERKHIGNTSADLLNHKIINIITSSTCPILVLISAS